MFDYLWIFHALYYRCRMAHFCNILPTGFKVSDSAGILESVKRAWVHGAVTETETTRETEMAP